MEIHNDNPGIDLSSAIQVCGSQISNVCLPAATAAFNLRVKPEASIVAI